MPILLKLVGTKEKNYLHTLILKYFSFDFAWNDRLFFLGHHARKAWHFSFFIMGKNIFQKWHFYNFAVFLYKTKCEDKKWGIDFRRGAIIILFFYMTKIGKLLTFLNITFRIKAKVKWIFSTISLLTLGKWNESLRDKNAALGT